MLKPEEVLKQSQNAFRQWGDKWKEHAKINGKLYKENGWIIKELLNQGLGKSLLCVGFGPSLEKSIELIKKYRNNVDIACVDKAFHKLLEYDIVPDYVFVADAGIDYERWGRPAEEYSKDVILLSNVTANPEWAANWKGRVYFYVNKDNIQSEAIFSPLSGCKEVIPAASNVGNSIVVFGTHVLGYDKYFLVGYDSAWGVDDNYYAYNTGDINCGNKRYWMSHLSMTDYEGKLVNTSSNLLFTARWLADYCNIFARHIKIFNCSGGGILSIRKGNLEKKLRTARTRKLSKQEKESIIAGRADNMIITAAEGEDKLKKSLSENNVLQVELKHISEDTLKWLQTR
ncbi:MAG: 6-hydroxymethylpterin diphosphokinase MptE-like protein [Pseudomonadota bacterium]|nr:6-hydroxymethylpterin diphosphokinase MptE-like protein [Pseudomonadota bacterium]